MRSLCWSDLSSSLCFSLTALSPHTRPTNLKAHCFTGRNLRRAGSSRLPHQKWENSCQKTQRDVVKILFRPSPIVYGIFGLQVCLSHNGRGHSVSFTRSPRPASFRMRFLGSVPRMLQELVGLSCASMLLRLERNVSGRVISVAGTRPKHASSTCCPYSQRFA